MKRVESKADKSHSQAPSIKTYAVAFYNSFQAAYDDQVGIRAACSRCDQLNVVIRAEGNMDDPKLLGLDPKVKVFAGAAWTTIHERRKEEGWYDAEQPWKI